MRSWLSRVNLHPPQSFFGSTPESVPQGSGVPRVPGSQAPKTNRLAVVSLILGLVWIWWVTSILAIVFALIALRLIMQRNQKGRDKATVGLGFGMMWLVPLGYFSSFGLCESGHQAGVKED